MKVTHHDLSDELDDAWWAEAGMDGFSPTSRAYRTDPRFSASNEPILEVAIADIGPVHRTVGIFKDDDEEGLTAKERVVRILRGFWSGDAIRPVELVECGSDSLYRYKLTHGTHRLYCSLAAGFTHIPAVKGFDFAREG